jgi:hypothetical protein
MKRITIAFCTAVFLFSCGENKTAEEPKKDETSSSSSTTDSKAKTEAWIPVDSATAMKNMMAAGTPGPMHAMLAKSDGNWTAETKMWWTPDGPPQVSKGTCTNKMIMGGRYQHGTFKGDFGGMPFEGVSLTGYDNTEKVFTSTWYDNMSTTVMHMKGSWDDATKSITFKGRGVCAANGQESDMREVYKIIDDNTQVMEMYGPDMKTGKEFKGMEITFTRNK